MIPYTFNLMNLAVVAGLYHFVRKTAASEIWVERAVIADFRKTVVAR